MNTYTVILLDNEKVTVKADNVSVDYGALVFTNNVPVTLFDKQWPNSESIMLFAPGTWAFVRKQDIGE